MRDVVRALCWRVGSFIVCSIIASSVPIPVMDIADLAERADLVAIGQVILVTQKDTRTVELNGTATRVRVMAGEMRVDHTLKGAINATQLSFEFELQDTSGGYSGIAPASYRMLFLKKTNSGYSFVSNYYPSVVAIPGIPPGDGGTLDNISLQLESVVKDAHSDISRRQEALYALRTLQIPRATAALERALQEKSIDLQLVAAAALLERNDTAGMQIAEAALTKRPPAIPGYLLHNLTYAISEGVRNDRAVPALARLLQLPDIETRRAAASALWHTHSDAAASALAAALNDQDFEVRFYSVIGLAEITGQSEWHPNMEVFHGDETRYLEHWRNWAQENYPSRQKQ